MLSLTSIWISIQAHMDLFVADYLPSWNYTFFYTFCSILVLEREVSLRECECCIVRKPHSVTTPCAAHPCPHPSKDTASPLGSYEPGWIWENQFNGLKKQWNFLLPPTTAS